MKYKHGFQKKNYLLEDTYIGARTHWNPAHTRAACYGTCALLGSSLQCKNRREREKQETKKMNLQHQITLSKPNESRWNFDHRCAAMKLEWKNSSSSSFSKRNDLNSKDQVNVRLVALNSSAWLYLHFHVPFDLFSLPIATLLSTRLLAGAFINERSNACTVWVRGRRFYKWHEQCKMDICLQMIVTLSLIVRF